MKFLVTILCICLLTSPMLCEEKETITGRSYNSGGGSSYRGGYGYGGNDYGGGHYGGYNHGHYSDQPTKKLYFDLGIPLVVGGLGLGLGVGALKGLILGAILGKKKHHLIQSVGYGGYGGGSGYGGYGSGYGYGSYGGYGGGYYKK